MRQSKYRLNSAALGCEWYIERDLAGKAIIIYVYDPVLRMFRRSMELATIRSYLKFTSGNPWPAVIHGLLPYLCAHIIHTALVFGGPAETMHLERANKTTKHNLFLPT